MKGCILMNRIKSFCKGVDQINSLLIKNIEILCQSMTFSVLELQRGYIYQLYQNGLEFLPSCFCFGAANTGKRINCVEENAEKKEYFAFYVLVATFVGIKYMFRWLSFP